MQHICFVSGWCDWSLFCCAVLSVASSANQIAADFFYCNAFGCHVTVSVLCLFFTVPLWLVCSV